MGTTIVFSEGTNCNDVPPSSWSRGAENNSTKKVQIVFPMIVCHFKTNIGISIRGWGPYPWEDQGENLVSGGQIHPKPREVTWHSPQAPNLGPLPHRNIHRRNKNTCLQLPIHWLFFATMYICPDNLQMFTSTCGVQLVFPQETFYQKSPAPYLRRILFVCFVCFHQCLFGFCPSMLSCSSTTNWERLLWILERI